MNDSPRWVESISVFPSPDLENGFVCRSDRGIEAEGTNVDDTLQFIKGAVLCAIGTHAKELPDDICIQFVVDRTSMVPTPTGIPLAQARQPRCDVFGSCEERILYACRCPRCLAEPDEKERFHVCSSLHMIEANARHEKIRGRPAAWGSYSPP